MKRCGLPTADRNGTGGFVCGCYPAQLLDVLELVFQELAPDQQRTFQDEVNAALQDEGSPWILCDGRFFQVDSKFLETEVVARAQELLAQGGFEGPLQEFLEARNDMVAFDYKGAIHNAGKAFESTLKALGGPGGGNPKELLNWLKGSGLLRGLPPQMEQGFTDSVLMALPFIRNRASGHGQGTAVVAVPRSLAELALHLAGTFILFLIRRKIEVEPPAAEPPAENAAEDIPF